MAGANALGSRAIIGNFYHRLASVQLPFWVPQLTFRVDSNQESEVYKWLGMAPVMREWVNGRKVTGLRAEGLTIVNKKFEATLEVSVDELRRDKTGQVMVRINELARRAGLHDMKLLTDMILDNPVCYDGQNFFDTDHVSDASGTQSNSIAFDLSDSGGADAGTATGPSPTAMARAIVAGIAQILSLKDDVGEPVNDDASEFIVMAGPLLMGPVLAATSLATLSLGESNLIPSNGGTFRVRPVINTRLGAWDNEFAVFRGDGDVKPFIVQEEVPLEIAAIGEGSEEEFRNDRHEYGVKRVANVGPGMWQHACKVTFQA